MMNSIPKVKVRWEGEKDLFMDLYGRVFSQEFGTRLSRLNPPTGKTLWSSRFETSIGSKSNGSDKDRQYFFADGHRPG